MLTLCSPALIYLMFSFTQILVDLFNRQFNPAVIKTITTIFVTILLNILCNRGFAIISWLIVFIPFMLMFIVIVMLLYSGFNKISDRSTTDKEGNIIIYDPNYQLLNPPFYYKYPNLVVTNPKKPITQPLPPVNTSSPEYQS